MFQQFCCILPSLQSLTGEKNGVRERWANTEAERKKLYKTLEPEITLTYPGFHPLSLWMERGKTRRETSGLGDRKEMYRDEGRPGSWCNDHFSLPRISFLSVFAANSATTNAAASLVFGENEENENAGKSNSLQFCFPFLFSSTLSFHPHLLHGDFAASPNIQ